VIVSILRETGIFSDWLTGLDDKRGKARILARLQSARFGNFGDCEPVGDGVSEMRIHFGPGYRIYFVQEEVHVYLLLFGGDKSTQRQDIKRALTMWRDVKENKS
jgi:putative addiction module killer protein